MDSISFSQDTNMIDRLVAILKQMNASPELWDETAKLYTNSLNALTRAGFTREEAALIISRQGPLGKTS